MDLGKKLFPANELKSLLTNVAHIMNWPQTKKRSLTSVVLLHTILGLRRSFAGNRKDKVGFGSILEKSQSYSHRRDGNVPELMIGHLRLFFVVIKT